MKYQYLLFDERYYDDPDRATCLTVSDTLEEAIDDREMFNETSPIVKYEVHGNELKNPEIVSSKS